MKRHNHEHSRYSKIGNFCNAIIIHFKLIQIEIEEKMGNRFIIISYSYEFTLSSVSNSPDIFNFSKTKNLYILKSEEIFIYS